MLYARCLRCYNQGCTNAKFKLTGALRHGDLQVAVEVWFASEDGSVSARVPIGKSCLAVDVCADGHCGLWSSNSSSVTHVILVRCRGTIRVSCSYAGARWFWGVDGEVNVGGGSVSGMGVRPSQLVN